MNKRIFLSLSLGLIALQGIAADAVQPVSSRIQSISMFKNGLALVQRTVEVPGSGSYQLDRLPEPVHGTFWIESNGKVATRATTVEVQVRPGMGGAMNFQQDLAGSEVTVFFSDGNIPPASGRVASPDPELARDKWSRSYEQHYNWWNSYRAGNPAQPPAPKFLLLETSTGRAYIDKSKIAYLQAKDAGKTITRKRPALLFEVEAADTKPVRINVSYLTKGIAWAPSYRVDISDPAKLQLTQKAVIKNELEDFEEAGLQLISGYPSIQFSHVTSPLSPSTSWAGFFNQLNTRIQTGNAMSNVMTQQRVMFNAAPPSSGVDLSATPAGEGVDLNYQDIGPHSMRAGDALALEVASAVAEYDRIVEWTIPDTRKPNGRYIEEYERNQNPEKYQDSPWDAVRFKNPFDFPLTTAAAMVVAKDKFNGQRTSHWVNRGEQTLLHITKALSVRTRHMETEGGDEREYVHVGGRRYRKVLVSAELIANNHRNEQVQMIIRRQFSGELQSSEGDPKSTLLESGVYSVNKRNELVWEIDLKPGEEIKRSYRYEVLVHH